MDTAEIVAMGLPKLVQDMALHQEADQAMEHPQQAAAQAMVLRPQAVAQVMVLLPQVAAQVMVPHQPEGVLATVLLPQAAAQAMVPHPPVVALVMAHPPQVVDLAIAHLLQAMVANFGFTSTCANCISAFVNPQNQQHSLNAL